MRFVDCISDEERERVHTALGELFFGCNLPEKVYNSHWFHYFCHVLRPAFELPAFEYVKTSLLDLAYTNLSMGKKNKSSEKEHGVLCLDVIIENSEIEIIKVFAVLHISTRNMSLKRILS